MATPHFSDYRDEARFWLNQAEQYEKAGELEEALAECDVAIAVDSKLAEAYNLKGRILEQLGRQQDAIRSYKKALKISPDLHSVKEDLKKLGPQPEEVRYDLVTIATFSYPMEAELAKAKLDSEGIFAFVADGYTVTMNWLYSNAMGGVKLQVPEPDVERALDILAYEPHKQAAHEADLIDSANQEPCPKCRSNDTEYQRLSTRLVFLSWLLLSFPLPFFKRKWKCNNCGFSWKPSNSRESSVESE